MNCKQESCLNCLLIDYFAGTKKFWEFKSQKVLKKSRLSCKYDDVKGHTDLWFEGRALGTLFPFTE